MPTTTYLNSSSTQTGTTGTFKRTLKANAPGTANPNQYIQPPQGTGSSTQVSGMWLIDSLVVPGATFLSSNSTSGITFIALQRANSGTSGYDSITLNVGPNASGNLDYGDSLYINSGSRKIPSVIGSTIIAGNETSSQPIAGAFDTDLVFFGAESSLDTSSYPIALKSSSGQTLIGGTVNNVSTPSSFSNSPLTIQGSKVYTGKDSDTLVFANLSTSSRIQNNIFDVGTGADFIYFAQPSTVYGGNVVNLGNTNGTPDTSSDTLCFNYYTVGTTVTGSPLSRLNGTTDFLTIRGFDNNDRLFYGGVLYTSQSAVVAAGWNQGRIRFDNTPV